MDQWFTIATAVLTPA